MNARRFKTVFVYLLLFLGGQPTAVRADITWLDNVQDCKGFAEELEKYNLAIGDLSALSPTQQIEIREIKKSGCQGRFSVCSFEMCRDEKRAKDSSSDSEAPVEKPSFDLPKEPTSGSLSWLKQDLTCDALKEQVLARYLPLGSPDQLNEDKKLELAAVKKEMCGPRFTHCNFRQCLANQKELTDATTQEELDEKSERIQKEMMKSRIEVEAKLAQEIEVYSKQYAVMIEHQIAREKKEGLTWQRFAVPAELQQREEMETPSKKPNSGRNNSRQKARQNKNLSFPR